VDSAKEAKDRLNGMARGRECPSSWSHDLVALTILQALLRIGRLHSNSWFSFGSDSFGMMIAESGAFWVSSDGRGLLCLRWKSPLSLSTKLGAP
jgi:hypothetical protein